MRKKRLLQGNLIICLAVFLSVCGASGGQEDSAQATAEVVSASETSLPQKAEVAKSAQTKTGKAAKTTQKKNKKLTTKQAFGKALWDFYQLGKTPDGGQMEFISMESASYNRYAIQDIDGDGKKELIIDWEAACSAGMVELVYGCKDGKLFLELMEYPTVRFYDDGAAEAGISHNQGLSGDFWPYTAYHYNASKDVYEEYGFVEAWDRKLSDANPAREAFPTEIDLDGDGFIYHFADAGEGYPDGVPYVDGDVYETWRRGYRSDDAKEITVKTKRMTAKNIKKLGYPRPYVKVEEPKG